MKGGKKLKKTLFEKGLYMLLQGVEEQIKRFDQATGRILAENGSWDQHDQGNMLALAFLYKTAHPLNRYYQNKDVLGIVQKAGNALREFQNPDGTLERIKNDGSRWGSSYLAWPLYHWLETYALICDELPEETRKSWVEGLTLAYSGVNEILGGIRVHNMNVYHAMALQRASKILNKSEWICTADEMITRAIKEQKDGYWAEHLGPTTNYNRHYVHALGLYHYYGGKVDVITSLEKSLFFHEVFTYPDGTRVETIDGRVKYNPIVRMMGTPGFSLLPRGRDYCRFLMERAELDGKDIFSPDLAVLLMNIKTDEEETPSLVRQSQYELEFINAYVIKKSNIFVCMSGFTAPVSESRWAQDRQMFVSVWHSSCGLFIGGGNSKKQPERSTFVILKGDEVHSYVPDKGTVKKAQKQLSLHYADIKCNIRIDKIDSDSVSFVFNAELKEGNKATLNLPIMLTEKSRIKTDRGYEWIVGEDNIEFSEADGKHWIQVNAATLEFEGPLSFKWPSLPFDPYNKNGIASMEQAVAILTLPVNKKSQRISIKFEG